jgi:NAD(P)-dependent dehydrogenase (short-subunit alcohol dehydrogenase family)
MLKNKQILIIGAYSDIGLNNANNFIDAGAKLHLSARTIDKTNELKIKLGSVHEFYTNDFSNLDSIESFAKSLPPELDGIVFALGHTKIIPARMIKPDNLEKILYVNFKLPVLITKALFKHRKIANTSSLLYYTSVSYNKHFLGNSIYSSAKIALSNYVRSLATELVNSSIRVNSIAPGFVKTHASKHIDSVYLEMMKKHYPRGFTKACDVSNTAKFLLSDLSIGIHGQEIIVDNGYSISL